MDYLSVLTEMLLARGLADNTVRNYQTYIKPYLAYLQGLGLSPDTASWQAIRDYLRYIKQRRSLSDRTVNMVISHLQFFHVYVLHKQWDPTQVPFRKFRTYLPFVPSRELVGAFIASFDDPKMKLAISILYATGLRLDELCHLQCRDIYLNEYKVHVTDSKNRQDRFVPLPAALKPLILSYWYSFPKGSRPRLWLFTQQRSLDTPMDKQWVQSRIIKQRQLLGIDGRLTAHSFCHAFATHSYENGMDLLTLKSFLGHHSINSTTIYYDKKSIMESKLAAMLEFTRTTARKTLHNYLPRLLSHCIRSWSSVQLLSQFGMGIGSCFESLSVILHFIYFQIHYTSVKFNKAPASNRMTFIASNSLIPRAFYVIIIS